MKSNNQTPTIGISGHGTFLGRGWQKQFDFALRECLERRGLRTPSEIAQSARMTAFNARRKA